MANSALARSLLASEEATTTEARHSRLARLPAVLVYALESSAPRRKRAVAVRSWALSRSGLIWRSASVPGV
ncbi:hypothetical protein SMALB_3626 [Streptomyces malaysiensis]|uniref:Uncharacterized protein n=1 Tax=Streptomyces malaysiensis TaxID=92644 RepID=A0A7X5X552_STRMQ|nr:hypothetical protein [Streptomyces malaysiensis]